MAEELAGRDQPAKLVTTQPGNVIDSAALRIGQAIPASERGACGVNRKAVLLLKVDRRRFNTSAIDRELEVGTQDQGTVGIPESGAKATGIKPLVQSVDPNSHVPEVRGNPLWHRFQLVCLELGSVAVVRIIEPPRIGVAGPAGFDGEPAAKVAYRG